jgi:hypothetical protein
LASKDFGTFVQISREMDDVVFAHINTDHYDKAELYLLGLKNLYQQRGKFVLRVFRRGNFKDFKEYSKKGSHSIPGKAAFDSVDGFKKFIKES